MSTVVEAIELIQNIAPEECAYKDFVDNIGLIVGRRNASVNKIMCCLDVTNAVLNEAIDNRVDLIISHHPMIFNAIKTITDGDVLGNKLLRAIENNIAIYAAHSNLDFVQGGINEFVAAQLGLRNISVLDPYISESEGLGRVGDLSGKVVCSALVGELAVLLKDNYIRIIGEPYAQVRRLAVINGGGGGDTRYIDWAIHAGADCLITADVHHHVAVYASDRKLTIIEPQHFSLEHSYIARLVQMLKLEAKSMKASYEIFQSTQEINPRFN